MSISRWSHVLQGRMTVVPQAWTRVPLLLLGIMVAASCARVPSPQETAMPSGAPAPPPAVAPVDTTTPPEPPPAEPMPPTEPTPEPDRAEVPVPPLEMRALTDVHWRLTDLGNAPVVAGALADRAP